MTRSEEAVKANVTKKIRELIDSGTVRMSLANLYQITPTQGVSCAIPLYRPMFERIAQEVAANMEFGLY